MELIRRAADFARTAHDGQVRKYTGEPFWTHPAAVAWMASTVLGDDEQAIAAAWLHDVVEDCDVSLNRVAVNFGARVASLVRVLSHPVPSSQKHQIRRAERMQRYREQFAKIGCPTSRFIKLCDIFHNAPSIAMYGDPKHEALWFSEKDSMLPSLREGLTPEMMPLYHTVTRLVESFPESAPTA